MRERYSVNITLVECDETTLYSAYLASNAGRLSRLIEEVYREEMTSNPILEGRNYIVFESTKVTGEVIPGGHDFYMPSIKYTF